MKTNRTKSAKPFHDDCKGGTSSYVNLCLERLRQEGGRISAARLGVVHTLARARRPLVAKEILKRTKENPTVSSLDLVSVYRNLEALAEKGLVHQVGHKGGYFPCLHSECRTRVHVLTHCESCEQTTEIHVPESLKGMLKELSSQTSKAMSQISTFQIEGLCHKCAKRSVA